MGNFFSRKVKEALQCFIYLESQDNKEVKCKINSIYTHHTNSYIFFQPNKKINYLDNRNIRIVIQFTSTEKKKTFYKEFELLNNLFSDFNDTNSSLFDTNCNIHKDLYYSRVGDTEYLEKKINNIHNDFSIKVKINKKNNRLERIVFNIPREQLYKNN